MKKKRIIPYPSSSLLPPPSPPGLPPPTLPLCWSGVLITSTRGRCGESSVEARELEEEQKDGETAGNFICQILKSTSDTDLSPPSSLLSSLSSGYPCTCCTSYGHHTECVTLFALNSRGRWSITPHRLGEEVWVSTRPSEAVWSGLVLLRTWVRPAVNLGLSCCKPGLVLM